MAVMKTRKVVDETHAVPDRNGGGILKRLVWVDEKTGQVSKYSLVYINHMIYALDNGRVVGFDNNHGYHHMHYMGKTTPIDFVSFEHVEEMFEAEFTKIVKGMNK